MTKSQQALLAYIYGYLKKHRGISPSHKDMMAGVDCRSTSEIHRMVMALKDAGLITQQAYKARSIYVTDKGKEMLGE